MNASCTPPTSETIIPCFTLLFCGFSLTTQDSIEVNERPEYTTSRVTGEAPVIDGILDEAAWETVEWGGDFNQRQPDDAAPVTQETAFKIL